MEENIDNENDNVSFENVFEEVKDNVAFTNRRLVAFVIIEYGSGSYRRFCQSIIADAIN